MAMRFAISVVVTVLVLGLIACVGGAGSTVSTEAGHADGGMVGQLAVQ